MNKCFEDSCGALQNSFESVFEAAVAECQACVDPCSVRTFTLKDLCNGHHTYPLDPLLNCVKTRLTNKCYWEAQTFQAQLNKKFGYGGRYSNVDVYYFIDQICACNTCWKNCKFYYYVYPCGTGCTLSK